ncbi:hypothetical protein FIBSPDRAFT_881545 [Athelia psychrophila]|uniref:Uncharacterized protein n=1 Tax=Athelia psychrophila TaxID=1759441 RepID=A0A166WTH9_9AGAM|nr:hypothetical protein FIBSPDRAFT_881545 [Fibularhizoctonia sp. CBS 109695]
MSEKRKALESVNSSIQLALDTVIVKKDGGKFQDSKQAKLAAAVATLIGNAKALGLDANVIEETMKAAQDKDDKTAKRWMPIMQTYEIKKNENAGDPIEMGIIIGMKGLTKYQANEEPVVWTGPIRKILICQLPPIVRMLSIVAKWRQF